MDRGTSIRKAEKDRLAKSARRGTEKHGGKKVRLIKHLERKETKQHAGEEKTKPPDMVRRQREGRCNHQVACFTRGAESNPKKSRGKYSSEKKREGRGEEKKIGGGH